MLIANLDPSLARRPVPESPLELLEAAPGGLVTQEVAVAMAEGNDPPDRRAAEALLIELAADRRVRRVPLGDDALWVCESALAAEAAAAGFGPGTQVSPAA